MRILPSGAWAYDELCKFVALCGDLSLHMLGCEFGHLEKQLHVLFIAAGKKPVPDTKANGRSIWILSGNKHVAVFMFTHWMGNVLISNSLDVSMRGEQLRLLGKNILV